MTATPAKLKDGTWGARVAGSPSVGDTVRVTTRAGKSWDARVERVVWSGDGVALCTTSSLDGGPPRKTYDPDKFNGYGATKGGYRRACKTDGNCSSIGSGRSCGGYDCDGY